MQDENYDESGFGEQEYFGNQGIPSHPMVNGIMDEIDSMVADVIRLPESEHSNALMNIIAKISEECCGSLEYGTIIQFVNDSYASQKNRG